MADSPSTPPWYAHPTWFRLLRAHALADAGASVALPHPEGMRLHLLWTGRGRARALSNYYTPLFDFEGGQAPVDPPGLAASLGAAGVQVLDLAPIDSDAPAWRAWGQALRGAGFWVASYPAFGNWLLALAGRSYADYQAGLPGPLRTSLQRGRARLKRAGACELQVLTAPGPALEQALADYESVYARSWKPTEGAPAFIRSLALWMAEAGALRLGVLRLNGEPLAAQMWFVQEGVASIFKLAYVQDQAALSPGTVLTAHLMEHVIDQDKVHTVDFLSGDDAYKRDWMSHRRQRVGLLAFSQRHPRGWWAAAKHALRQGVNRLRPTAAGGV